MAARLEERQGAFLPSAATAGPPPCWWYLTAIGDTATVEGMQADRLEAILFETEVFASEDGRRLGLRTRWPGGETVAAEAEAPDAVLEAFRVELETSGKRRLGGNWVAVPVAEPRSDLPSRLDRSFVLLPIDLLNAGVDVLGEIGHSAEVEPPERAPRTDLEEA